MIRPGFLIRPFRVEDTQQTVQLWRRCNLIVPWNDPYKDIQRKLEVQAELFLVAVIDSKDSNAAATDGEAVAGTVMAGYEGHRGWINYLATDPGYRRRGIATALMEEAENLLQQRGCPKINLQIRESNL
ncbi:MAG: GNAT family acetyltransferase, partial [Leptospiraceae bacterium]|nr:GNAT family acetyltransferase [Leptospiraceae bacterium]